LTDILTGRELVGKAFVYLTTLTKECRKALTAKFQIEHKGIPFDSIETTMRQDIESWFAKRDKNIAISHDKSLKGRPGEILMTYSGVTKGAHFKIHVESLFTLSGSSPNSPAYLKNLNIYVDKREFMK
jgi:hypothetical protein